MPALSVKRHPQARQHCHDIESSDGGMHGHDKVEAVLNALEEDLAIVDIDVELSLEGIMNKDAGLDVDVVIFRVPIRLEGHRHAIPTLGINVAEAISHTLDDALGQNSWLNKESRLVIQVFLEKELSAIGFAHLPPG